MTKASHQRAIMRRAVISGVYPNKLTARVTPAMLKPDANVLREWDVAHNDFAKRLAEILIHHYDMVIRKERDIQGLTQETIRDAIESSRLPDKDLEYIQRFWSGETEKASEEAKTLAKKQAAQREKVAENRKRQRTESAATTANSSPAPNPATQIVASDDTAKLREELKQVREDLAKLKSAKGRGKNPNFRGRGSKRPGRGRGRGN